MIYAANKEVTDDELLVQLLYKEFLEEIKELDLSKDYLYGIQFYKYDYNQKYHTSKIWDKKYSIYIHSDLDMMNITNIFRVIGYKLKKMPHKNEHCSSYELIPTQKKLKKDSQLKLF
jgi:hypothetical protein